MIWRADGIADIDAFNTRKADDIAGLCLLHLLAAQAVELVDSGEPGFAADRRIVMIAERDFLPLAHRAVFDAPNGKAAHIIVKIDGGDQNLQRRFRVALGRVDMIDNGIEQRL